MPQLEIHRPQKSPTEKKQVGNQAERLAQSYLEQSGLIYCATNFSCKTGEIDLIMMDEETLVFVEVRYRANSDRGSPLETVTLSKQRKLIRAASYYLQQHFGDRWPACRFDVIGISGPLDQAPRLDWIVGAFNS